MINPIYFYAGAGVILISGMSWLAHDLRERGRIEAMRDISEQAQRIEIDQTKKQIQNMSAAFAVADAAMTARSVAYEVAHEKAKKLQIDGSEENNGRSKVCGDVVAHRGNAGGVSNGSSRDGSDTLRMSAAENSSGVESAEKCRCAGQSQTDIRRNIKNKLVDIAERCDKITADYNALLEICKKQF